LFGSKYFLQPVCVAINSIKSKQDLRTNDDENKSEETESNDSMPKTTQLLAKAFNPG
jgi:hypothetical protein